MEELLKIGEDPSDLGGYFIINGLDRIVAPEHFITAVLTGFYRLWNYWARRTRKSLEKRPSESIKIDIRQDVMHDCIHRTLETTSIRMGKLRTNEYTIFEYLPS
jgi:hypothetical protein